MFIIVLSHNNARSENGQRTVREKSEYSMTVLSTGSAREAIIIITDIYIYIYIYIYNY